MFDLAYVCTANTTDTIPTPLLDRITPIAVSAEQVPDYLRRPRFVNEVIERIDRPGVATGLAWTPTGGDVLFVEATMMPSQEERLILTGMLGDVMRESVQAALSYIWSNADRLLILL
ncbi:hypothetical protein SD81_018430 [Tolypothrix campylonemoides VB511288]|nr:hypothetical protein SD81_018430 [Tolypothrix campylonemoides VB511288]